MQESGQERTEQATPKRLRDARKRGQVSRSAELPGAAALVLAVMILRVSASYSWQNLQNLIGVGLLNAGNGDITVTDVYHLMFIEGGYAVSAFAPLGLTLFVIAVAAGLGQTGLAFSPKLLTPRMDRINPANGLKRMFSLTTLFEMLKQFVRIAILGFAAYIAISGTLTQIGQTPQDILSTAPQILGGALYSLLFSIALVGGVLAAADYAFQRWRYIRQMRMTKQEVRDEQKELEGNPQIKSRIRRMQRALAKKRMMDKVKKSTMVITNPTHFAVALYYQSGKTRAPVVTAKGQDFMAQTIKETARKYNIPIIENPPLARSLYASAEVDREIPIQLYRAVAEVIAFIYRIKRRW